MAIKYPHVHITLPDRTDPNGNVFNIIGLVSNELKSYQLRDAANEFASAAFRCKTYDAVLDLCRETVTCDEHA